MSSDQRKVGDPFDLGKNLKKAFGLQDPEPPPPNPALELPAAPPPPPPMPVADDQQVKAAQRRSIAAQRARRGRASTILSTNLNDPLGA